MPRSSTKERLLRGLGKERGAGGADGPEQNDRVHVHAVAEGQDLRDAPAAPVRDQRGALDPEIAQAAADRGRLRSRSISFDWAAGRSISLD